MVTLCILGGIAVGVPYLVKKGVNLPNVLAGAETALETAEALSGGLAQLMPGSPGISVIDAIVSYSKKAVQAAEQMYLASQIEGNKRKEAATQIVLDALGYIGIKVDDKIKSVINGCIEAAVFLLPKTSSGLPSDTQ